MIELAKPKDDAQYMEFYASIKPVKFGNTPLWTAAGEYNLASYQIPRELSYVAVCRVECYEMDRTAAAADFGLQLAPPSGTAYWQYQTSAGVALETLTDRNAPVQRLLDADEYLFFTGGNNLVLVGNLLASPDANTREIRTLVYGYNLSSILASRLARSEVEIPSQ